MVEVKLSKRAAQLWDWINGKIPLNPPFAKGEGLPPFEKGGPGGISLHQANLARQLGCSRWTIGRAIKKLKEAGLLQETGRDKQSRCKTYALLAPSPLGGEGFRLRQGFGGQVGVRFPELDPGSVAGVTELGERGPTPQGLVQLENYRRTFELNFIHWPDWEKHYAKITWELKDVHCIHKLFRQTFDRLYEIRATCN